MLLGLGWVIFFINTPLYIIQQYSQKKTFQYLTKASGAQLAGAGLSALVFNPLAEFFQSHSLPFLLYFALGTIVLPCFYILRKRKEIFEDMNIRSRKLSFSRANIPMVMIATLAGVYSGVTLFQHMYAESRNLNSEIFFLYFTMICVICRLFLPDLLQDKHRKRLIFIFLSFLAFSMMVFIRNSGSEFLYVVSTCFFSLGYCFLYSLLHEVALPSKSNVAEDINSASQLFSLFYFIGLFGFPWVAGKIIKLYGMEQMLIASFFILLLNFIFLHLLIPKREIIL